MTFALGLDYGTSTVRALIADTADGNVIALSEVPYPHGNDGVIVDPDNPDLARQHPLDYLECGRKAIRTAREEASLSPGDIVGIGVDTTGSTPLPTDARGHPLAFRPDLEEHPAAMAWLWKDHTAASEASELTEAARREEPRFLESTGGSYSPEWFWAKLLRLVRGAPGVIERTAGWIELADWIPAVLTGREAQPVRSACPAGHKGWFHRSWGGYPSPRFLERLDPHLARIRRTLPDRVLPAGCPAGRLTGEWAGATGLRPGTPVSAGILDAHAGAVGCGIREGTLVKILGTSTCDIVVSPLARPLPSIPGLCGIAPDTVLPGHHGLEAGQSAVGDIFHWWVRRIAPGSGAGFTDLERQAEGLAPGESGLLALDWNNGNRSILCDPRLSGLLLGQSLHTGPHEVYRALIEATAFGARAILDRIAEHGVEVRTIVACGGLAERNPLLMRIYADITNRPMRISASPQTCALGAAICGAVAAGVHPDFPTARKRMTRIREECYRPRAHAVAVYDELYRLYRQLHDAFGLPDRRTSLHPVMKRLLEMRDEARRD